MITKIASVISSMTLVDWYHVCLALSALALLVGFAAAATSTLLSLAISREQAAQFASVSDQIASETRKLEAVESRVAGAETRAEALVQKLTWRSLTPAQFDAIEKSLARFKGEMLVIAYPFNMAETERFALQLFRAFASAGIRVDTKNGDFLKAESDLVAHVGSRRKAFALAVAGALKASGVADDASIEIRDEPGMDDLFMLTVWPKR